MKNTQRRSGILMHISSLPSQHGIGTLGKEAYAFVDFLQGAGLSIWQVLPIGPTGFGDSPYQSFSMYAGNPYFIDLDTLAKEGILHKSDLPMPVSQSADYVDYGKLYSARHQILCHAYTRAYKDLAGSIRAFERKNPWLHDYALFCALKDRFGGRTWLEWPEDIRMRRRSAMARCQNELKDRLRYYKFVQYLFYRQWFALKKYANKNGIRIFGDMPIYVAMDSADTWAAPEAFLLDSERRPTCVAGVPPDYFTQDGQLWGNPLYDWDWHKRQGYRWWKNRMRAMKTLFDLIRIDHFIGFAHYYAVAAGAQTAKEGEWHDGPGYGFFRSLGFSLRGFDIVAEDLGVVTQKVRTLREQCGFPGMKVLLFGFDSDETNVHLPHHVTKNTVYYTGTHDNDTALGWWQNAGESKRRFAASCLGLGSEESICRALIRAVLKSDAQTAIIPIQDYLGLGNEARMNTPGTIGGNWTWRLLPGQIDETLANEIRAMNAESARQAGK